MMMDKLRLQVLLSAVDKVSGPLKKMLGASAALSGEVKGLHDRLKGLKNQNALIGKFRNTHKAIAGLSSEMTAQQAKVKALAAEHAAAGEVTAGMARKMKLAQNEAAGLKGRLSEQRITLQALRDKMGAAGLSTTGLAAQEKGLRTSIEQTNAALEKQRQRLKNLGAAREKAGRMATRGAGISAAGMGMAYGANRAGHAAVPVMGQARHATTEEMRIKALGLGTVESNKAIQFAKDFKSYGTSQLDNLELMRDAVTVFNDRHHAEQAMPILADMKFANEAAFGEAEGADNARKFMDMMKVIEMRGGANNKEDFERNANYIQQVITATGGRVGAADWMHVIQRGKLAAKGFDEKEFFYRLEPLVQEMGGNAVGTGLTAAYQNLYQGRTTKRAAQNLEKYGLIGDFSKVKHDKVGQTSQLNPGALKGSDIFRRSQFEWMETVLIPSLRAKGIESEQATIDAIGSIFSNTNGGALMATMYQQRSMIQKGYELNAHAANIADLKKLAMDSGSGKEVALKKRRDDLYMRMGDAVLPGYVKLLEVLTAVMEKVSAFAARNSGLTKVVLYTAAGVTMLVGAIGALAIPVGLLLAKGALLRFVLARLGLNFGSLGRGATLAGASLRAVTGAFGLLSVSATMVYNNWDGIMGGLGAIYEGMSNRITEALQGGIGKWVALFLDWSPVGIIHSVVAFALDALGITLPDRFSTLGGQMLDGLISGIKAKATAVKDAMVETVSNAANWFKEKLGNLNPVRVFMQVGNYMGEGAALGIQHGAGMMRTAAVGMAAATMVPLTAIAAPGASAGAGRGAASSYQITINAAPGMDPQAIALAMQQALDKRDRAKRSRTYSQMSDTE
jgi:hypothetical protein